MRQNIISISKLLDTQTASEMKMKMMSLATKHQMMMAYYSQANALKPAICVTKVSTLPLELLEMKIPQSFKEVYPTQTSAKLTSLVIHHGTKYAAGMVLPYDWWST